MHVAAFLFVTAALFFDGIYGYSQVAYNDGAHVKLMSNVEGVKNKYVQLVLREGRLDVQVNLDKCMGEVLFCYNSTDKMDPATNRCNPYRFCGFYLKGTTEWREEYTGHGNDKVHKQYSKLETNKGESRFSETDRWWSCSGDQIIRMQYWKTLYCPAKMEVYSCAPKMDDQNRITLYVDKTDYQCEITIRDAHLYEEPTTPAPTPPPTTEAIEKAGLSTEWIIVICAIVVLILFFLGIGLAFAYLFGGFGYLKRKLLSPSKPKKQPSNTKMPMRLRRTITFTEDKKESQIPKTKNAVEESAVAQTPEASAVAPSQAAAAPSTQKEEETKKEEDEKVVAAKTPKFVTAREYAEDFKKLHPDAKPAAKRPPPASKKAPEVPKSERDGKMKSVVASTTTTQTEASVA